MSIQSGPKKKKKERQKEMEIYYLSDREFL